MPLGEVLIDRRPRSEETRGVHVLVVIGDELLGTDDARDWTLLESLVAANGPASIEVYVLALINEPKQSIAYANPLGRATGRMAAGDSAGTPEPYDAAGSARQRLNRSLQHLRSMGLNATGDTASGDTYGAVHQKAQQTHYDRVLLLLADKPSWVARTLHLDTGERLRRSLHVPVDTLGRSGNLTP